MIDYDATLQSFFEYVIKYLDMRAARAHDKEEAEHIANARVKVQKLAANPKKYADYQARIADRVDPFDYDFLAAFIPHGTRDNSALLVYSDVVASLSDFYSEYDYARDKAHKTLLNKIKAMKYKTARGGMLKDFYYPFLSPSRFAVKVQNQK